MHKVVKHGIGVLVLATLAVGLYQVKYQVQEMRDEAQAIEEQLVAKRKSVQVMSAEWAYLARPDRLAELQKKYLPSAPVMAQQVTEVASLPQMEEPTIQLAAAENNTGVMQVSAVVVSHPNR